MTDENDTNVHVGPIPFGDPTALASDERFQTDVDNTPNYLGVVDRMMRPDHFLNKLRRSHEARMDIMVGNVEDLNLTHVTDDKTKRTYFAISPNPNLFPAGSKAREWFEEYRRMPIDESGLRSMCHQIGRTYATMRNFDDPVGRLLNEFHDWFRAGSAKGLIVRTITEEFESKRTVDAFVPGKTNLISNYELMSGIFESVQSCYGDCIRGVQMLSGNSSDNVNYRILFGNPLTVEESDKSKALFLMFSYMGSEHALSATEIDLGFWRLVCSNGAMRRDLSYVRAAWNRFNTPNRFMLKVNNLVEMSGVYANSITRKIEEMRNTRLNDHPLSILDNLRSQRLIDSRHCETAILASERIEEDSTWGMFNLLTDAAKTHSDLRRRSMAESNAMRIAMQPNGFNGVMAEGFRKGLDSKDLHADLKPYLK